MKITLVLVLALVACADDKPYVVMPDGGSEPVPDSMPDTPPEQVTLTSYVIDLIANQTTATALPRPYTEFNGLADPDGATNNLSAYQSLFP